MIFVQRDLKAIKKTLYWIPALLLLFGASTAKGQYIKRWLDVGSYHHDYSEAGANTEDQDGSQWPAIMGYKATLNHSDAIWVAVKGWEGPDGKQWPYKIAHIGPRALGFSEIYTRGITMKTRFPDPQVYVDGELTFGKAAAPDTVDPTMKADRMLSHTMNFLNGIEMHREIRAFSQQFHDNYHIIEYTFTNTGNIDGDPEREFPDRTLEPVYFYFSKRWGVNQEASGVLGNGAKWGRENLFDMVGPGFEDSEVDFPAQFAFTAHDPGFTRWDPVGAPAITDNGSATAEGDSVGRITAPQFAGRAVLHADNSAEDTSFDPTQQPHTMNWFSSDDDVYSYGQTAFDEQQMAVEWNDLITYGRETPHHANFIDPNDDFAHPPYGPDPELDTPGGYKQAMGYGPYTLEPGESVHIVMAGGASGLSLHAAHMIGEGYKAHWREGNDFADIPFDADGDGEIDADEIKDKNEWIMTGRDSLMQTFKRAIANYGAEYNIPTGPRPPKEFRVVSGIDAIDLSWQTYDGAQPQKFEIYRTQNTYRGAIEANRKYEKIATVPFEAGQQEYAFKDEEVVRGIDYYYYLQTVGDVNENPTGNTPTGVALRSNRHWTQTYDPASLRRAPGATLSDVRVVPNPYNLASSQNVRWPDRQDKLGFLNVPGEATIKIYTERGDLVNTIQHNDGSGDAYWDLTTSSNQVVVSGLYIAVITNNETGKQIVRKFVIIR